MLDAFFNEILVLGQIPGTNFQITFDELLILTDVVLVIYLLRHRLGDIRTLPRRINYFRLYFSIYLSTRKGQQLSLSL